MKKLGEVLIIGCCLLLAGTLNGCSPEGTTQAKCLKSGYSGIIIRSNHTEPVIRCSDGEMVQGKIKANGSLYPTYDSGLNSTMWVYLSFTEKQRQYKPYKKVANKALTIDTIEKLQITAETCNKAKMAISTRLDFLNEREANSIIKDCSIFKLEQELQK